MFDGSAAFYDRIYAFYDYGTRCREVVAQLRDAHPQARSLLDAACGTGRYLELLSPSYETSGFDLDATMVATAQRRCPTSTVRRADLRDFDFGRCFDVVVCLFRSIAYVQTVDGLRAAIAAMARHLNPGGVLLIEPFFTPEQFWLGHLTLNVTEDTHGKIAWMYTSEVVDGVALLDIHYLIGTPTAVTHLREQHRLGLFRDSDYAGAFADAGLRLLRGPRAAGEGYYLGQS